MHAVQQTERSGERFLTVGEAASLLCVSPSTIRNWDRTGKLKARRHPINGYRLYARSDLSKVMLAAGLSLPAIQEPLFHTQDLPSLGVERADRECREKTEPTASASALTLDAVHEMDCIAGMRLLSDASVDIAIADPPYNASKGGEWEWNGSVRLPGFGGNWKKIMEQWDSMGLAEYCAFTAAWLGELKRVVRPTGSIWIHGTYHNAGIINFLLQCLGIEIINEVVWFKRNSFPNLSGRRLTASHETILWAHTGRKRTYYFDYEGSKVLPCPGDLLKTPGRQMRTVWDIPNNKERDEIRFGRHPAQKPVRLISRMISLSAKPGWVCLVPFAGVGSECIAAKRAGLHFIAFETNAEYVSIARERIAAEETRGPILRPGEKPEHPSETPRQRSGSRTRQVAAIPSSSGRAARGFKPSESTR